MRYELFGWRFDEGVQLDDGFRFDDSVSQVVHVLAEVDLWPSSLRYVGREVHEVVINALVDEVLVATKVLDLMSLVPNKFRSSVVWQQFIEEASIIAGSWLSKIDDLSKLVDPYRVGEDYLYHLGNNIGWTPFDPEALSLTHQQLQLVATVEWYKMKGAYPVIYLLELLTSMTFNYWDLYTEDYATFVRVPWWVANSPGENPPGVPSTYYKSPHFGVELVLDTVYGTFPAQFLYYAAATDVWSYWIAQYIELDRPINTVPHLGLYLDVITYNNSTVYVLPNLVQTIELADWTPDRKYFDEGWDLDDGIDLDQSDSAFLAQVTHWKLGVGNKYISPGESSFALADVRQSGTIVSKTLYPDRVEFELEVDPAVVEPDGSGYSELGIFLADTTTMVVASTFPSIFKVVGWSLRVVVTVRW